jgi:uncharacterized protein YxjI
MIRVAPGIDIALIVCLCVAMDEAHCIPRDPTIRFDARFVLQQPIEMKIKEQLSFSGDDFTVTDAADGELLFTVDGKAFSIGEKKNLLDYSGALFGTFRKQSFSLGLDRFEIADASGREIGVINSPSSYKQSQWGCGETKTLWRLV